MWRKSASTTATRANVAPTKYDGVSYATTVTFVNAKGLAPIPAGPPATPGK